MMGMRMPETCWAVFKRRVINLRSCCILFVDSVETHMRTCGCVCAWNLPACPKRAKYYFKKIENILLKVGFERNVGLRGSRKLYKFLIKTSIVFFSSHRIHINWQLIYWYSVGQECNIRAMSKKFKILFDHFQVKNWSSTMNMRG